METLKDLIGDERGGEREQGGTETVCWFCLKKRRKADMRFVTALKKTFTVREVEVEKEGEEEKNVHL